MIYPLVRELAGVLTIGLYFRHVDVPGVEYGQASVLPVGGKPRELSGVVARPPGERPSLILMGVIPNMGTGLCETSKKPRGGSCRAGLRGGSHQSRTWPR